MTTTRDRIAGLALLFVSTMAGLAFVEGAVRYLYGAKVSAAMYQRSATRSYALKPNFTFTAATGVVNRSNALGLPERELPLEKAPGEFRILVLGDSCTHNTDVPFEERFTSRVEAGLAPLRPGGKVTVVNGGVTGYNIHQMMTLYDEVGKKYHPDLVILHYLIQDSFRRSLVNETFLSLPGFVQEGVLWLFDHSALIRQTRIALHGLTTANHFKQMGTLEQFEKGEAWRETRELLAGFRRRLEGEGIPFVLQLYTSLHEVERFAPYYRVVERFAAEEGIPFIATDDLFAAYPGELSTLWVSPSDSHPNGEANRIIAGRVIERLAPRVAPLPAR